MPAKTDPSKDANRYEEVLAEVEDLAEDIERSHEVGKKALTDPTQEKTFQARLSRLDSCFEKFMARILELKRLSMKLSVDFSHYQDLKETTYSLYYETIALGIPTIQDTSVDAQETTIAESQKQCFRKLPSIKVPTFDGNITKWPTFKDTFLSLIHTNPDLDAVHKFHYLKSSLSGTAAQAVAAIEITSTGYNQAWQILTKRFDNKRILATNHLMKILNSKPITKNNLPSLEQFSAIVIENAQAFLNLSLANPAEFILCILGLRLLDSKTKEQFETKFSNPTQLPGLTDLSEFIQEQYLQLQSNAMMNPNVNTDTKSTPTTRHVLMAVGPSQNGTSACPICSENHRIFDCAQFRSLSPRQRYDKIKTLNRCLNCLSSGHKCRDCPSANSCRRCNIRHHTLLHFPNQMDHAPDQARLSSRKPQPQNSSHIPKGNSRALPLSAPAVSTSQTPVTEHALLSSAPFKCTNILLGTAIAHAQTEDGKFIPLRVLLDCGSQRSFITTECARKLSLPFCYEQHRLLGLGNQDIVKSNATVHCVLSPNRIDAPQISTSAIVIDQICSNMPSCRITPNIHKYLQGYNLADPEFYQPKPIDFLLGADLFGDIFLGDSVKLPDGMPYAMNTIFGWVLVGKIPALETHRDTSLLVTSCSAENDLSHLISKSWEIEEITSPPYVDPLATKCEAHFIETHRRDDQGRYIINLPFQDHPFGLEKSKFGAIHVFKTAKSIYRCPWYHQGGRAPAELATLF